MAKHQEEDQSNQAKDKATDVPVSVDHVTLPRGERAQIIEVSFNRLFLNWIGWKVIFPLLVIIALWPLIYYLLDSHHSFGEAFAHGDLLVFSALVLLEAATEGEYGKKPSFKVEIVRLAARILAIFFIAIFILLKYDLLRREHEMLNILSTLHELTDSAAAQRMDSSFNKAHGELFNKMRGYSCLNCTVALVSVVGSILLFWINVDREKRESLEELAQKS